MYKLNARHNNVNLSSPSCPSQIIFFSEYEVAKQLKNLEVQVDLEQTQ
jgi:hypothetical protein